MLLLLASIPDENVCCDRPRVHGSLPGFRVRPQGLVWLGIICRLYCTKRLEFLKRREVIGHLFVLAPDMLLLNTEHFVADLVFGLFLPLFSGDGLLRLYSVGVSQALKNISDLDSTRAWLVKDVVGLGVDALQYL